jgi:leader peptidase (prepilin peptidase)/N-methyltransferase
MHSTSLLAQDPTLTLIATAVVGLAVGSFLNVVAHRLPRMLEREWREQCAELLGTEEQGGAGERFDLAFPPSRCPHCGHRIRPTENIPVLSYLFLKGRCSACKERISLRYPVVEALTAILSVAVIAQLGTGWAGLTALGLTWALIALTLIDLDHQLLPDILTLALLWAGLALSLAGVFTDTETAVLGAIFGYLVPWTIFHVFKLITGKEGMGHGDFKLLAAFGAWLGWQYLPQILVLSTLVGAIVGIAMIVALRRDRRQPIPFGPYLAAAGWVALMWGDPINQAYLRWSGLG